MLELYMELLHEQAEAKIRESSWSPSTWNPSVAKLYISFFSFSYILLHLSQPQAQWPAIWTALDTKDSGLQKKRKQRNKYCKHQQTVCCKRSSGSCTRPHRCVELALLGQPGEWYHCLGWCYRASPHQHKNPGSHSWLGNSWTMQSMEFFHCKYQVYLQLLLWGHSLDPISYGQNIRVPPPGMSSMMKHSTVHRDSRH